jgi:hypothetical protein
MNFPPYTIGSRYHRAEIPNQSGFLLTVFLKDGAQQKTVVSTRQDGSHFLAGVTFADVTGWTPRKA